MPRLSSQFPYKNVKNRMYNYNTNQKNQILCGFNAFIRNCKHKLQLQWISKKRVYVFLKYRYTE